MNFQSYITEHLQVLQRVQSELSGPVTVVAERIFVALRQNKKILIAGNGGSAADAQHFAAELIGRYLKERASIAAIALTTDSSILTAVGNDYGFSTIFSRQIEGLATDGDVVVLISTSGNSENLTLAAKSAKDKGCVTVGLLGKDGGDLNSLVDYPIVVSDVRTPHIQEAHLTIIHFLCQLIEEGIVSGEGS